jgi:hypothetical protein
VRADETAIENAKTGKVTAVVAVMSISCKKKCNVWSTNPWNTERSCQKAESVDFPEENSRRPSNLSQKTRKCQLPKELSSK